MQTPKTMKLFGSRKKLIDKKKNGENIPSLEVVEIFSVQCNLADKQYHQKSKVLNNVTPNKPYAYLINVELNIYHSRKIYLTNMENNYWMLLLK